MFKGLRTSLLALSLLALPAIGYAQAPAAKPVDAKAATPAKPADAKAATPAPAKADAASPAELLDINTATEDQLKSLVGIGDAFAKKIVAGRPYANKTQLVAKKILNKATYDKVQAQIIAKQAVKVDTKADKATKK